jgi:hypothetical protein
MTAQAPTPARKTAPNVRLVEPLKSEASAKAKDLGISLNALVSMAVRQYLDGQSCDPARDPLVATLFAELDKAMATPPGRQKRALRQPGASALGGRSAPHLQLVSTPTDKRLLLRTTCAYRHPGPSYDTFILCPLRHQPAGLLGAGFAVEYARSRDVHDRAIQKAHGMPSKGDF